ncbi:MAG TPA: Ni/Fe-hydrogenase cytochrome b subunit [Symbiobacteriaceae bacterium]|nr:Ni/Fe-hydrogenase cytochrome b subunit [Symbiobacteriaceae bacterium]
MTGSVGLTKTRTRPAYLTPTRIVLWGLLILGLVAAFIRYTKGMGAISNMNNVYSFGLWISLDLLCGVALAAGAFTTCAAVYILGKEEFRPLVKPAVLTGFLGYLAVVLALLVDLGRPERIWHMLIYWNPHSPLFEIGLCVMTYTTVLFFEFSPTFFEWVGWNKIGHFIHKLVIPFVILGTVLSTLHQSSLGTLFVMMSDKINPLWHSAFMPLFFFVSAATAGLAMVIFESTISMNAYGRKQETHLLGKLAKAIPWMLGLYLTLKISELLWSGDFHLLFEPGKFTPWFWIEICAGVILPMILFSLKAVRKTQTGLFLSSLLVILGLMFNRFNIGLLTWKRPAWDPGYVPHWMEFALSIGVISGVIIVYDFVARNMNLFHEEEHGHAPAEGRKRHA